MGSDNKESCEKRQRVQMSSSLIPIDSTLFSAIIAALVAFVVLALDRYFIEPRKWRERLKVRTLEKVLEVYGSLVTILKSCRSRALMQNAPPNVQYTVDRDDMRELEAIFEGKSYLLGGKLQAEWNRLHEVESRIGDLKDGRNTQLNLPLRVMRETAERDYRNFLATYMKLTGLEPSTG
jgi:hypothetical protein